MSVSIELETDELSVEHTRTSVKVSFEANEEAVLNHFDTRDAVAHFGEDDLLAEIGEDKAREYFGIE